jgi:DNA-binding phage protein
MMTEKTSPVTGITVGKLLRASMLACAAARGIAVDASKSDESLSESLHHAFVACEKAGGEDECVLCDNCGGGSPSGLDWCPFCEPLHESAPALKESLQKPAKAARLQAVEMAEVKAVKPAKAAPKLVKTNAAELKEKPVRANAKAKLALVEARAISPSGQQFTEENLDSAIREIHEQKVRASEGLWELGRKIAHIYDNQLWKLRSAGGKPKFKTVDQFCQEEIGMSPPAAWKLMSVAKEFTASAVKKFGTAKLGLVLQAPDELREAMLEKVEAGIAKAELEKDVVEANKGRPTITTRQGVVKAKPMLEGASKPGPKSKQSSSKGGQITVASILGTQTQVMYCKASMRGEKSTWTKAKTVGDAPCAVIELENAVVQIITLLEHTDGTLKIEIKTRRLED